MDTKIAQAIAELVLENQRLGRELGEVREAVRVASDERVQMELERNEAVAARKASTETARRWHKVASAYEILTPPVGGRRIMKLAYRDGWQCAYCGVETCFTGRDGFPRSTVDHVVPKSKGGLDNLSNCVVACQACNAAKADQEDWSPPPKVDEPKTEISLTLAGEATAPQCRSGVPPDISGMQKTWEWRDGMFRRKKHEE